MRSATPVGLPRDGKPSRARLLSLVRLLAARCRSPRQTAPLQPPHPARAPRRAAVTGKPRSGFTRWARMLRLRSIRATVQAGIRHEYRPAPCSDSAQLRSIRRREGWARAGSGVLPAAVAGQSRAFAQRAPRAGWLGCDHPVPSAGRSGSGPALHVYARPS